MAEMTDKERLDYLYGHILAMGCAVKALIDTHPNPAQAIVQFKQAYEVTEGLALPVHVHETLGKGMETVREYLTRHHPV